MGEAPEYPYPPSNGKTHYPGCWRDRGHHNCAVAEIARLREALELGRAVARRAKLTIPADDTALWRMVYEFLTMEANDADT